MVSKSKKNDDYSPTVVESKLTAQQQEDLELELEDEQIKKQAALAHDELNQIQGAL